MQSRDDTIAAIATPAGMGGIGIIKMSGPRSAAITERIFQPRRAAFPLASHRLYYGEIVDPHTHQILDEVLVSFMARPLSYTREDVIEINCHGGYQVLQEILSLVISAGARLAEPGEFTRRAFLNGRIDLAQAEAVIDLIEAQSAAAARQAAQQLTGTLSREINRLRDELLLVLSALDASIEFPEEDIDLPSPAELLAQTGDLISHLAALMRTFDRGRLVREGACTVIAGKPNVGKSTLFNRLLNEERAIVTPYPGTTRDCIEESLVIKGIPLRLVDTAGLRDASDHIEEAGVRIANRRLDQADITVLVIDGSAGLDGQDEALLNRLREKKVIVACNKADLPGTISLEAIRAFLPESPVVTVSALLGTGIEALKEAVAATLLENGTSLSSHAVIITTLRHARALEKAMEALEQAQQGLRDKIPPEFVAADLQFAAQHLGEITGTSSPDEVLDGIFSRFCIGK
jgi:tRNA modification GTPase